MHYAHAPQLSPGFFVGVLPGHGSQQSPPFMSYAMEKNLSKTPETFGKGAIEGLAAPEGRQ